MYFSLLSSVSSALALATVLSGAAAVRPDIRKVCADGEVVSSSTIAYGTKQLQVTMRSCPGISSARGNATVSSRAASGLASATGRKRQVSSCSTDCYISCGDTGSQAFISDCDSLTDALEALYPESFLSPSETLTTFSMGEACEYGFVNYDSVEYEVCYIDVGYNGAIVADDCFGDWPDTSATTGGYCDSPDEADNDWELRVFYG